MHGAELFVEGTPAERRRAQHIHRLPVYEVNADAIAFYEALGYRLLSRRMARTL